MNCEEFQNHTDELLDGVIATELKSVLHAHLAACPDCAKHWREQERIWKLLSQVNPIAPSTGFVARTVRAATAPKAALAPWWTFWAARRLPIAATALLVALLVLGGIWFASRPAAKPEIVVVENQEVLANLPLLTELELLEDLDEIEVIEMTEALDSL